MEQKKDIHAIPCRGGAIYANPLPITNVSSLPDEECVVNGDPFVMKSRGEYWCYSTGGDGIHVLHSTDLVHFTHLGYCFQEENAFSYWAPCVIEHNGRYYMYYASNPVGDEDDHAHYLKLAVADHPAGPFTYAKQFFRTFSIDAHAVRSVTGRLFLFYSVNNAASTSLTGAGTAVVMDELLDPYTLAGDPMPVILPSRKEEIFARNRFGDGRDWHTIEGASYFERGGDAYILYSANAFTSPDYFLGLCAGKVCGDMREADFKKLPDPYTFDPFMAQSDIIAGTGHCSTVKAPNNVDEYVVYHGYDRDKPGQKFSERSMRIDPILFGHGNAMTTGPSRAAQDAPAFPLIRRLYNGSGLDREDILSGEWTEEGGCLCQHKKDGVSALIMRDFSEKNYLIRASLEWKRHHYGGKYGLIAAWVDEGNRVEVWLDQASRSVNLTPFADGVAAETVREKLPRDFDFECFHDLSVSRTGDFFAVSVDDVPRLCATAAIGSATVGLFTAYTRIRVDSFEATGCLLLTRDNARAFAASCRATGGFPEKNFEVSGAVVTGLKGDLLLKETSGAYRFSAWCEAEAPVEEASCGVIACAGDSFRLSAAVEAGDLVIRRTENGAEEVITCGKAGRSTLFTVIVRGGAVAILADKSVIYDAAIPSGARACGLTCAAPARFGNIEYVKI